MSRLAVYLTLDGMVVYFENPVSAEAKQWREIIEGRLPRAIVRLGEIEPDDIEKTAETLRELMGPAFMVVTPPKAEDE